MDSTSQQNDFHVPTIDIAPYLLNPRSSSAEKVIDNVREACISSGFFQITGHGVPSPLQKDVFRAATKFFALPLEEKKRLDASMSCGHRGYDVLASQSYEEGVEPDLKEGYYIGTDIPVTDPLHGRFFMGPNIWPPAASLLASEFQIPCQQYYEALSDLSQKVLALVGATLASSNGKGHDSLIGDVGVPRVFHDLAYANTVPACPLRLLHYPSATRSSSKSDKPQYGASAHTDFGAVTLLLQDDNPGLEVLDTSKDSKNVWRSIEPNPNAYVVNIGDVVSNVTGGLYKSSIHRVVCKRPERERYSIVYFFDGCLDAMLVPAGGASGDTSTTKTVEQHMIERLTMSYGTGNKDARHDTEVESA